MSMFWNTSNPRQPLPFVQGKSEEERNGLQKGQGFYSLIGTKPKYQEKISKSILSPLQWFSASVENPELPQAVTEGAGIQAQQ